MRTLTEQPHVYFPFPSGSFYALLYFITFPPIIPLPPVTQRGNYRSPYGNTIATLTGNSAYRRRWGSLTNWEYHHGIDTAVGRGTPLLSIADGGEVIFNGFIGGYGHTVIILYSDPVMGYFHAKYSHMNAQSNRRARSRDNQGNIVRGDIVNQGDQVGAEGNSPGGGTAIHLHFSTYRVNSEGAEHQLHPPIRDIINPLTLLEVGVTPAEINASGIFRMHQDGLAWYYWERGFLNDFKANPRSFDNRYHQSRPLNNLTIINTMNRFFRLDPLV